MDVLIHASYFTRYSQIHRMFCEIIFCTDLKSQNPDTTISIVIIHPGASLVHPENISTETPRIPRPKSRSANERKW